MPGFPFAKPLQSYQAFEGYFGHKDEIDDFKTFKGLTQKLLLDNRIAALKHEIEILQDKMHVIDRLDKRIDDREQ